MRPALFFDRGLRLGPTRDSPLGTEKKPYTGQSWNSPLSAPPGCRWDARQLQRCCYCYLARHYHLHRYRAFSLPGQFAPRSESANRTLANSLPGTFAPWPSRSLANSFSGPFAPRPFRSRERKFYGTFAPLMCLSPCTFAVLHLWAKLYAMPKCAPKIGLRDFRLIAFK